MTGADAPTTAAATRIAAIDVGTNSIRLMLAEAREDGTYRLLDDEKVITRLGRGMTKSSELDPEAMVESSRAIAHMKSIADGYNVSSLRAVATCAVREAANQRAFVDLVRHESGVELEVIGALDEARLAFSSVTAAFDLRDETAAVVDIGGGSTEIILSAGGMIEHVCSLALGAVRMTELIGDRAGSPGAHLKAMRKRIRRIVKDGLPKPEAPQGLMVGTGGTLTALAYVDAHRRQRGSDRPARPVSVRGYELTPADARRAMEWLNAMTPAERRAIPGLSPERAEIIVAGLAIVDRVAKRLGVDTIRVHDRGIRDGLLLRMTRELYPDAADRTPDRLRSVHEFAGQCDFEHGHCAHVTELALQIYDQLADLLPEPPAALTDSTGRELLHVAGLLHDAGYHINYARHHRHSYHLIMHSDLDGFTHRELEIIANVARYHRKAHPKPHHENFGKLAPEDRQTINVLAAILRIADGLDRAHAGNVTAVRCEPDGATMQFTVNATAEPEVDLWGAARKSRLFHRVFGLEPRFTWAREDAERHARRHAAGTARLHDS